MKKTYVLLCAAVMLAAVSTGCSERKTHIDSQQSSSVSAENTPDNPGALQNPDSTESNTASSASEQEYPLPELTPAEEHSLSKDAWQFASFFGKNISAEIQPEGLDGQAVLNFSLSEIERHKIENAYYFEQDSNGNSYIPQDLVSDTAQRLLGLNGFTLQNTQSYSSDKQAYIYSVAGNTTQPPYSLSTVKGAPNNQVTYIAEYDSYSLAFTFSVSKINGEPYLKLTSIAPAN